MAGLLVLVVSHGSHFDCFGRVFNRPATKDLMGDAKEKCWSRTHDRWNPVFGVRRLMRHKDYAFLDHSDHEEHRGRACEAGLARGIS